MILIKLITKNFKKLADHAFDFAEGLNVIAGENAQGKSTLLQAIEAALFGVTAVPGKKENIPTWGQANFSLELYFEVEGREYHLTRNKSSAKLVHVEGGAHGDALLANGNTPVTKYIEELLGLTAKDWNLFVQSKQGETSGVLTFGATALNQKVEEFAGISLIDEVAKKAQERASERKAEASALAVDPVDMAEAESALREAVALTLVRGDERNAALSALNAAEASPQPVPPAVSSAELSRQRRAADQARTAYDRAAAEESAAAEALVVAENDLKGSEIPAEVGGLETSVKEVKADIAELKKLLAENRELQQSLNLKARIARQAADEYAACEPVGELVLSHAHDSLANAIAETDTASSWLAEHAGRRKSLESLAKDATCPTCGTQLSEHDPEKLQAEIAAIRQEEDNLLTLIGAGKQEVARLTARVNELEKARDTYLRLKAAAESAEEVDQDELATLVNDQERLQACLDVRHGDLGQLTAQIDAAATVAARHATLVRRVEQAEKRLAAASQERLEAEGTLFDGPTDVEIDAAAIAEAEYQTQLRDYQQHLALVKADVAAAEHACNLADIRADSARHVLETLQGRAEKAKVAEVQADQASRLARFLRDRRQAYLKEVWDGVLGLASRQVRAATAGLITRITYDGEFQFEEDGILAPVTAASGAQKAFIGTAVRIGLARALYGRDSLLIFDEPTEAMSERNAMGLAASLVGAAHQTLLITHRDQDQSLAANIITIGE